MDNEAGRIVLTDAAVEREAGVALRFACGGCSLGFLLGSGLVGLFWFFL